MTWLKRILLFLISAVVAGGVYFKAKVDGWFLEEKTSSEIAQIIEPHLEIFRPDGDGPFKTILMFHGCGGDQSQQRYWGEVFRSWGYAAVYVNSYAGRNIDQQRADSEVCKGEELLGAERAADVHAAVNWSNQQPWVNQHDLVLAGWSHGAWTIMDAFALQSEGRQANGISNAFETDLALIRDVVLFYPYCGIGSKTSETGWVSNPNVLTIDAAQDTVVGTRVCDESLSWIEATGSVVQHEIFEGVDHAFDAEAISQRKKEKYLTPKEAALDAIEKAKLIIQEFLR